MMSRVFASTSLYLIVLAALLFVPQIVSAQTPPVVTGVGPSSGTAAAAALETVGYRAQSIILNDLGNLLRSWGFLIFIVAAVLGLSAFAIYGSYDGAMWLLIGPALFLFLIGYTIQNSGAEWRFGNYSEDYVIRSDLPAGSTTSRVSWFFDKYNRTISGISQTLIALITSNNSQNVIAQFTNREQILNDLLSTKVENGGLITFMTESLAECSRVMNASRSIALGGRDSIYRQTAEYREAEQIYRSEYSLRTHNLYSQTSKTYLKDLFTAASGGGSFPGANGAPTLLTQCATSTLGRINTTPGGIEAVLNQPVTCEELWCWMGLGVQQEVARVQEGAKARYGLTDSAYQELLRDIVKKLTRTDVIVDANGNVFQNESTVNPDLSLIPVIIGGYLLRDVLQSDFHSGMLTQFANHSRVSRQSYNFDSRYAERTDEELLDINNKLVSGQIAELHKYELFTYAMTIPYLQGVLLYILALLFPFFCLLVLIPGKFSTFVLWLKLWAWTKSWDVGWAIVMLLDKLLWQFFPHSVVYDPLRDPNHGPISVFQSAFDGDPSYSLGNYYVILGTLITAVPLLMGQAILGMHASIFRPLLSGIQAFAQHLGGSARIPVSVEQQAKINWMREQYMEQAVKGREEEDGDPRISRPLRQQIQALEEHAAYWKTQEKGLDEGIFNLGAMTNRTLSGYETGNAFQRSANALRAELTTYNMRVHNFNAGQSDEFYVLDSLRGGASARGEYWNLPDSYGGDFAALDAQLFDSSTAMLRADTRTRTQIDTAFAKDK